MSERFERFLEFHSGVKRWQVEFQDHSRKYIQVYISRVREMCVNYSRELGYNLSEEDLYLWNLLDIVSDELIPDLCKSLLTE